MILRQLSPAKPGCVSDLHSILEALRDGHCALAPLKSLVGNAQHLAGVSHVGGIAGKIAINIGDQGVLTVRRSIAPVASFGVKRIPIIGQRANQLLSGNTDLPGGKIEPKHDKNATAGVFREADEEGVDRLPEFEGKKLMVGCYTQGTSAGVEAVVRFGIATAMPSLPDMPLSREHTKHEIMLPNDPRFPVQWGQLGDTAMGMSAQVV